MRYELVIRSSFSAAHYLRSYKGEREGVHGHNWSVEARIVGEGLDGESMVVDFIDAKAVLDAVLDEFDHTNINDHPLFAGRNPTTELMARYVFEQLAKGLKKHGVRPSSVTLFETPECGVVYRES